MSEQKIQEFIRGILSSSKAGSIAWQKTASDNTFSAVVAGGKYVVKSFNFSTWDPDTDEGTGPPSLGILDKSGNLILDITEDIAGTDGHLLGEIYLLARSQALGVDKAIDEILSSLDDIPF